MATIPEIRQKYPQYNDLSDQQLADAIYAKSYSDMPRAEFDQKIGLATPGNVANPSAAFSQATANASGMGLTSPAPVEPSILDKLMNATGATVNGITASVPFLQNTTDAIGGTVAQLTGGSYDDYVNRQREVREGYAKAAPLARVAGEVGGYVGGGALLGGTKLGAEALGMTGSLGKQALNSMLSSAGISTADALSQGKTGTDALASGALGGITGLAGFGAGQLVGKAGGAIADAVTGGRQAKLTTSAIKGAPAASELKDTAANLFKAVDQSGVTVNPDAFRQLVLDLATNAKKMRINDKLDPKAYATFQELGGILGEVMQNGKQLTMSDLHTIRQIAQKAAISAEGRDAMFANQIVDGIDAFVTKPGATMTPNGPTAGNQLLEAISTWGRAKRVGLVETAIEKAQNTASGFENGIRIEFRKLLNNKRTAKLFTATERSEMEKVVQGTTAANLAKLIGKFGFGPGANGLGGFLGGTAGLAAGGPIGAVLTAAGASGARKLSEKLTEKAANRAAQVVATPNIPTAPTMGNPLIGAKVPIELLIRGGGMTAAN
ncbi:MAG: hypothetical protein EOO12_00195 [Chitinophagaceae bacterium]|nr:MAG: hypothetical protein EOO12_00195 [Chitinophagaceae bacterium]